jgi:formylglycine-generating enzyme required for sulfatase activity
METDPFDFQIARAAGTPLELSLAVGCSFRFAWCPPGVGVVGSERSDKSPTDEQPRQPVRLTTGFWMGTTPVTCRQWREVMTFPPRIEPCERDEHPVVGAAWADARAFCGRLTQLFRERGVCDTRARVNMPTEAQWEYACRAGTLGKWFFGDDARGLDDFAWYRENSGGSAHPVATRRPNPWGLYDLYGNVAEWCLDQFRRYTESEVTDPMQLDEQAIVKIVRGGDFSSPAGECRSAYRGTCDASNSYNEPTGVRLVLTRD